MRFSSPGRLMRPNTGCPSALTVSIANVCHSLPQDRASSRRRRRCPTAHPQTGLRYGLTPKTEPSRHLRSSEYASALDLQNANWYSKR